MDFGVQPCSLNAAIVAIADVVFTPDDGEPAKWTVADVVEFVCVER